MDMKKIVIVIFCLFLFGCGKKEVIYEDTTNDFLNTKINNVEVYEDTYLNDIIEIVNDEIKLESDNYKIDTTKLGVQNLDINYEYKGKKYVYHYEFDVKDTTPPLVFSGTKKTVNLNYDKDICNLITYGDNYSGNIKCEIVGEYDLSKEGVYNLTYNLSDSSKNTTSVNVVLTVTNNVDNNVITKPKVEFSDLYQKHKTDDTEIGIDVSKWQGDIDFNKVRESGATFVMIRIGSQRQKGDEIHIDEYFEQNIENAQNAGLKVGVYFYSTATAKSEAINQANWVVETLNNRKLDLPIVFDWENWENWNSYKISFYEINEIAESFIDEVKNLGYEGMLYSSKFYLETIWTNKKNNKVWLAHYIDQTNYEGDYVIWQTSNTGKIDGIKGDVDIDIIYK